MKTDPHPIEALALAALVILEAVAVLTVALVALLLTVAHWRPAPPPPPPMLHPLALVAEELESLPVVTLRTMTGIRSKRHRKADLVALAAAC